MRDAMVLRIVRSRGTLPPRFQGPPPEVNPGLELYMKCFWDLCGDRDGLSRIPWGVKHEWCVAKGLDAEAEDDVHFLVGRLDMAYLEWFRKEVKRKSSNGKPD